MGCADGGCSSDNENSAQPCGCDPGCKPKPYYKDDCHVHSPFGAAVLKGIILKGQAQDREDQHDLIRDGRGTLASVENTKLEQFATGATRNMAMNKPDYEGFLSPEVLAMYGDYMHANRLQKDGNYRDSDNWQKGIPIKNYMKSLLRHVFELWFWHRTGRLPWNVDRERLFTPEELFSAIMFNVMGYAKEWISPSLVNQEGK